MIAPSPIPRAALDELDANGFARTGPLLDANTCAELAATFDDDMRFRNRIVMERHGYGAGEYRYFSRPFPAAIATLRAELYRALVPLARAWSPRIGLHGDYPDELDAFTERCAGAGQGRPTPLLLRYRAGDWNALHRDLYGDVVFPLQVTIALSQRGTDYDGGEFVLIENRPRRQSRAYVVPLDRGEGVVFATRDRPMRSKRGTTRVAMRHGVSTVTRGERITLGIIFNDAL